MQTCPLCHNNSLALFLGMNYLHKRRIMHRDLKPHNGMLSKINV